jgi:hypothetical protein
MIVFELICPDHHRFEGWFASAEDFDGQKARGLLSCPVCADSDIEKLLTAKIGKTEAAEAGEKSKKKLPAKAEGIRPRSMNEMLDLILLNTEDVGEEFPEEARRIHRKQTPQRNIRGVATREETEDLLEEGVPVMPLPIPPRGDWH